MLDVDPPGVASLKVAGELFIPGRRLERIGHENIKKLGSLRLQVAPFELPCILLGLSGKDDFVTHQSRDLEAFLIPSFLAF